MNFKKSIKFVGVTMILIVLFRGIIYRSLISYTKIKQRKNIVLKNKKMIRKIENELSNDILDFDELINICDRLTREQLDFTSEKASKNPNEVLLNNKANCIGYSALFNSIGNYIITKKGLANEYEFRHLLGELDFLGYNIHQLFNKPFYKNHDYNAIHNKITDKTVFVDPSLSDYLRIQRVSSY